MLQINTEDSQTEGNVPSTGKRNPFDFFSNIFRRKGKDTEIYVRDRSEDPLAETERGSNPKNGTFLSDSIYQSTSQLLSSSRNRKHANVYTHCPIPHPEMETLCLSREDNPYIQEKLKKVGSDHDFPDTAFSSPPTLDKEKLINTDGTSEQEETGGSMHVHLIRSPPPGFPRNITEFVFSDKKYTPRHSPKKIRQPHDLHFPTETTSTAPRRRPSLPHGDDLHCLTETSFTGNRSKKHSSQKLGLRASSSSLPSLEVLQKRDTKRNLNPLFSKTGLNVIDPGIKKILLSQKQKLFSGNTHACVSNDRNCGKVVLGQRKENNNPSDRVIENGVSPDKTLPFVSSRRQQNKRSSPVILCSTSSFRALPLSSSVSLPGLNVSDNYDPPKCLTPIQGLKSNTGNLPLSSVKELGAPSKCFGAKRNVKQLGE